MKEKTRLDVCYYCIHHKQDYAKDYICINCDDLGGHCNFVGVEEIKVKPEGSSTI